jgi:hypothetical protein
VPEQKQDLGQIQVGFDGMAMPVDKPLVTIEAEKGPVQGAGITWSLVDDKTVISVEFQLRGQEPTQFHLTEQDDGSYEVISPPVFLPNPKEF